MPQLNTAAMTRVKNKILLSLKKVKRKRKNPSICYSVTIRFFLNSFRIMNEIIPAKIDKIMANTILPITYCSRLFSNDLSDRSVLNLILLPLPIIYPPVI